jgi:hypothetical protein
VATRTGGTAPHFRLPDTVTLAVALAAAAALLALVVPVLTMGFRYEKLYGEGWNAYHAARAAAGETLYSGDPERLVNYPFLSFYLVAWLKPILGDVLYIGRALSLLGLLATVAGSAFIVRRLGGERLDAAFAAACVLGFLLVQAPSWIGANDPQLLAEGLMIGGLACYLGGRVGPARLAATVLLFALAGFTKHNLVAIPAAVTIDILINKRPRFALWCGFAGGVLALFVGLTYLVAGGDFLNEILAPRVLSLAQMKYHPQKFAIAFKIPVLLAAIYLARTLPSYQGVLLRAYAAIALITAILFSSGEGVSFNIFLDVVVCLAIVLGLALQRWRLVLGALPRVRRFPALLALLPLLMAQPVVTRLPGTVATLLDLPATLAIHAHEAEQFVIATAVLRSHSGPALCESLLMCFDAGKPLLVDTFNTRQMILTGRMAEADLLAEIAARRFAVIELPTGIYLSGQPGVIAPNFFAPPRLSETALRTIDRYYRSSEDAGGRAFYVPKP